MSKAKDVEDILSQGIKIFDNSESDLVNSIYGSEFLIYDELIQILNNVNVSNGKLQNNKAAQSFLLTLDTKIYSALKNADYDKSVLRFTKSFDLIADNSKQIQSALNGINITNSQISPILNLEVNNTIDKLTGAGIAKDFVNPIRETLYRNILVGADIGSVEKTLKDYLISTPDADSNLVRYSRQVARDSMQQFDGTIQGNIGDELNLNAIRYVGSLKKDSRPQCERWIKKDAGILLIDDLNEEIKWAFEEGSGMIKGTDSENFYIFRGGWNCRHRAIATIFYGK